jgi:thiol-disulfide isomerase/thioredoxin
MADIQITPLRDGGKVSNPRAWAALGSLLVVVACATTGDTSGSAGAGPKLATIIEVPPPPEAPPVPEARIAYYKGAFPSAASFEARLFPKEFIPSADAGNETYVVAKGKSGETIGYLRDFTGPVSLAEGCPCSPLNLTLAFNADLTFRTILAPSPLEKKEKQAMTEADLQRLIELARNPPEALLEIRHVEQVVDATTEATRTELAGSVVADAGYSTYRIVHLVQVTRKLLEGSPITWDTRRLKTILETPATDAARAEALAAFMQTAESEQSRLSVFKRMTVSYIDALRNGGGAQEIVEAQLLAPGLTEDVEADVIAAACYEIAAAGLRLRFVRRCLDSVGSASTASRARLEGTLRFAEGDAAGAAQLLAAGARDREVGKDPRLYLRLAEAMAAAGRHDEACAAAKTVFRAAPILPGARRALRACSEDGEPTQVIARIQSEQRRALLATRRDSDTPASTLSLEGPGFVGIEVPFGVPGKVSVVVFFATWCPHCLRELPLVNAFARGVQGDPVLHDRVRVVGVRTAVEREQMPYEEFLARFEPAFDIWFDATMSLQFGRFAKEHGIVTSLPRIVVADETGVVRYLLRSGDYRDIRQELTWAVESLRSE